MNGHTRVFDAIVLFSILSLENTVAYTHAAAAAAEYTAATPTVRRTVAPTLKLQAEN